MAKARGKERSTASKPAGGKRSTAGKKKSAAKKAAPSRKGSAARKSSARSSVISASANTGGPLTLAQARALVRAQAQAKARAPKRALRRRAPGGAPGAFAAAAAAVETVSPGAVGAERKRLALQRRRENQRRIREYAATLELLKRRGVKGLAPEAAKKRAPMAARRRVPAAKPAAAPGAQPLQILAEGDSWFDYPVPFFGGGIIPRLESRIGVPILNLAKAGDEVRYMLGVEERSLLAQQLRRGCPAGGPWDVLLFSGGGNDVVDNPMALWIRDFDPALPAASHLHQPRFDAVLSLVRAGYEDLIAMRDALSPSTQLFFHAYDFAIPDGRGVCHLGPWLKPTFDLRGFPTRDAAFEVVKVMLQQFAALLQSLARPDVTFIDAQGTLPPQTSSWHNELHPSKDGFKKFAEIFHRELKTRFPGRVL